MSQSPLGRPADFADRARVIFFRNEINFTMRKQFLSSTLIFFLALAVSMAATQKPNLVFILTDNHGAWTLGCYGNKEIRTPNIDRLAAEGILFTRAFCNNSVCSPSRATFLTGLIPSQHGVHSYLPADNERSPS